MEEGPVWVISAEREAGKSLRRMRVRDRWCCCAEAEGWVLGVRERVQASLGRKRGPDEELAVVDIEGLGCEVRRWDCALDLMSLIWWLRATRSAWFASSHCVSQLPVRKSWCARMAARRSRFVLIPEMDVS